MNEREYDRINNEGGEGYNPYRAERERREVEEAIGFGKTRAGRKARIYRELEAKDCSIARESGTYNKAEIDDLRAQLRAIEAEEEAEFLAAWTLEITQERRESWNARVKAGAFGTVGSGKVNFAAVAAAEKAQGWTVDDLKKAVALHKR